MHFVYGFCDGNARAAVDKYQRHFPKRRIPSRGVFSCIHQTACLPIVAVQSETEVVRTINTERTFFRWFREVRICPLVEWPLASAYHVCRYGEIYMRKICILTMIKGYNIWNQATMLSVWILCHWIKAHPELLSVILFSDEASFTRDGVNNLRNVHMWSHDNPHETSVTNFQRRFTVNVLCGVLGNKLIRPFVFDNNSTGNAYEVFLRNELPVCWKTSS